MASKLRLRLNEATFNDLTVFNKIIDIGPTCQPEKALSENNIWVRMNRKWSACGREQAK
ncbi:MAG: hypothetical protein RBR43_04500 [Desulfuromonadaceae bacterium]|nr:hypothetical protein [Desulfuromonas sp.]MDY0185124.1 hypothetical protein [Desulfuromonadaceae bacterium]